MRGSDPEWAYLFKDCQFLELRFGLLMSLCNGRFGSRSRGRLLEEGSTDWKKTRRLVLKNNFPALGSKL